MKKQFCLLISISILIQGCQAYKTKPSTLDEAVIENSRAKITSLSGRKFKVHHIEKIDSTYYAVERQNGEFVRRPLNQSNIASVRMKSPSGSTVLTIGAVLLTGMVIVSVIFANAFDWEKTPNDSETTEN